MGRVTGIGGLFFRARDPEALAAWYGEHFGVVPATDHTPWAQEAGHTVFQPFEEASDYFGDPAKSWMVNFRVDNLGEVVAQLRGAGIDVTPDPTEYPYGRFARLVDPEGNPIELWQPESPPE